MFCIKCGKPATIGYLCKECFADGKSLFTPKDFTLTVCPRCTTDKEEAVRKAALDAVKVKIASMRVKIVGSAATVDVEAEGKLTNGLTKRERKELHVRIKEKLCDRCSQISGNYHEGVIQARGPNREKIFEAVRAALPARAITGIARRAEGCDVRVVKKGEAGKVAKALSSKYDVIRSYKLAGEKKGKKLYRSVYAIR
ncbi:MAG: hypothetical protein HY365_00855 [Candidatus Aenigmarchaeota archaeon]|nr:hypothetical protein [Candidatus Aenigmarchaeota archaeon]